MATAIVALFVIASFSIMILANEPENTSSKSISDEELTPTTSVGYYTYTVTFNANGGTCSIPSKTITIYDDEVDTYGTLPEATRDGYTFDGWFTSPTGGTEIFSDTRIYTNLVSNVDLSDSYQGSDYNYGTVLYAHYTESDSTISDNAAVVIITIGIIASLIALIAVINIKK